MLGTTARDYRVEKKSATQDVNCNDIIKHALWDNRCTTPEGKLLAFIYATMIDPQDHTGAICPGDDRIQAMTGWDEATLDAATADVDASGQWSVATDVHGGVRLARPLFLDRVAENKHRVNQAIKGSMDHYIHLFRYSRLPAVQRVAFGYATAAIKPKFNFLGSEGRHYTHKSPISGRKVIISALFDHPILDAATAEEHAELFHTATVPYDADSRSTNVSMTWLADKVGVDTTTLSYALMEPQDYYHVQPERDGTITFIPTRTFHQAVWELNRNAGGADRNAWEVEHGFFPVALEPPVSDDPADGYWCAPPLGDSWVYEIFVGDTILQVGRTTQPGRLRLRQHLLKPTNRYAELTMLHYMNRGVMPSIRIVARAHRYTVAAVEMAHLQYRRAQGHNLSNYIIDTTRNAETIKLDSRYATWSEQAVKHHLQNTYWADQEFYERTLAQVERAANTATTNAMSNASPVDLEPVAA